MSNLLAVRKQQLTVAGLARQAGLALDDTLIRLWEIGLEDLLDPADVVPRASQTVALSALGVEPAGDVRSIAGWALRLGISEQELRDRLSQVGVQITSKMRNLPKGSVAKVRRLASSSSSTTLVVAASVIVAQAKAPVIETVEAPFIWSIIGKERDLSYLDDDDEVLQIHIHLADQFKTTADPIEPAGVRDENLLSSAVSRPQTSLYGEMKYPTAELAAAVCSIHLRLIILFTTATSGQL